MPDITTTATQESEADDRRRALGAVIRAARGEHTQSELGQLVGGTSQAAVSAWENGLVDLTYEQLLRIEQSLRLEPGTLGLAAGYFKARPPKFHALSELLMCDAREAHRLARAANDLGFGVRVENCLVHDEHLEGHTEAWRLTVIADIPVQTN